MKQTPGVLVINWANPNRYTEAPEVWGKLPPKRNYIEIILSGNNSEDDIKLNFSQLKMREILSNKDTLTGIHFQFDSSAEYRTFIIALDICNLERARNYIPHENNLWFYYQPRTRIDSSNQIKPLYL